jgi:8-oxo-dGTP pyrophosphatase MutT (NUDIX family)
MITKPVPALVCAPTGHNPTSRTTPELAAALVHAAAVIRELYEELGIDGRMVELGAQLAERSTNHMVGMREVRQIDAQVLVLHGIEQQGQGLRPKH